MVIIPGIVASSGAAFVDPGPPPLTDPLASVSFDAAQSFWADGTAIQLRRTNTTGQRCAISWDVPGASADAEILARVVLNRIGSGTAQPRIGVYARGAGSAGSETGIAFFLGRTGKENSLVQHDGGTASDIVGDSTADRVFFRRYWLRLRVNGSDVLARIWSEGDTEPSAWAHEETTTVTGSGWVGLFIFDGNTSNMTCDYFAAGMDGATAPGPADTPGTDQYATTFDEAAPLDDWTSRYGANFEVITRTDAQSQGVALSTGAYQPLAWRPEWNAALAFGWLSDRWQTETPDSSILGLRYLPVGSRADASVVSRLQRGGSGGQSNYVVGRASGAAGSQTCYRMGYTGSNFVLDKVVNGSITNLGFVPATLSPSTTPIRLRLECQGTLIRARGWVSSFDEPDDWQFSVTDADIASGWWGLAVGTSGSRQEVYDFEMQE